MVYTGHSHTHNCGMQYRSCLVPRLYRAQAIKPGNEARTDHGFPCMWATYMYMYKYMYFEHNQQAALTCTNLHIHVLQQAMLYVHVHVGTL